VHLLQGKAELVTSAEMRELLRAFHREKHVMRHTHASAARWVGDYDFNNTYQYVIAREDMHLRWLIDAIVDLGGTPDESPVPDVQPAGKGDQAQVEVIRADRDVASRFVETWRPRVEGLPNARHTVLLRVILGETLEHLRFFDLALAGRTDLLGPRAEGAGTGGRVLPVRWVGGA
jgi:hypothetical protein